LLRTSEEGEWTSPVHQCRAEQCSAVRCGAAQFVIRGAEIQKVVAGELKQDKGG